MFGIFPKDSSTFYQSFMCSKPLLVTVVHISHYVMAPKRVNYKCGSFGSNGLTMVCYPHTIQFMAIRGIVQLAANLYLSSLCSACM